MQVTARSDRDLTPESIVQKVSDASGSKYSGAPPATASGGPPPPVSSKPAFTPTRSSGATGGFNPLANSRSRAVPPKDTNTDEDGWGQDAPPVTRTQLEKVQSAYQPTKVSMRDLNLQKPEPSRFNGTRDSDSGEQSDIVKGTYQPVGKVDIAALRRQAQESGNSKPERPEIVKGSYEPVGKVDIAAIRARAQGPSGGAPSPPSSISPAATGTSNQSNDHEQPRSLPDRSVPFSTSERLTSLPKPKVANRFGAGASNFTGTKAPTPGGFGLESTQKGPTGPPVGVGRTFADQGGKTPAQLWAEKKARERGMSGGSENTPSNFAAPAAPMAKQTSGAGEWKSGYGGKSWAPVQTTRTGQSSGSLDQQRTGPRDEDGEEEEEVPTSPAGGVSSIRDRFKGAPPMGVSNTGAKRSAPSPPPLDTSNKPNAGRGIPIPGLPSRPQQQPQEEEEEEVPRMPTPPPQPPRSPTPPTPPATAGSPIRVAMPVGRGQQPSEVEDAREEQFSPPPSMPTRSLAANIPHEDDLTDEPSGHDPARGAGQAAAAASFGGQAVEAAQPTGGAEGGKRALVQYDYEKAEDNELELREGEYITDIDTVDEDWWHGRNSRGESGLFPSNYVELVEEGAHGGAAPAPTAGVEHEHEMQAHAGVTQGHTATALYEYDAAEGNELTFPENAKITNVVRIPVQMEPNVSWLMRVSRNFRTRIGGLVNTMVKLDCSPRTTLSWMNEWLANTRQIVRSISRFQCLRSCPHVNTLAGIPSEHRE